MPHWELKGSDCRVFTDSIRCGGKGGRYFGGNQGESGISQRREPRVFSEGLGQKNAGLKSATLISVPNRSEGARAGDTLGVIRVSQGLVKGVSHEFFLKAWGKKMRG